MKSKILSNKFLILVLTIFMASILCLVSFFSFNFIVMANSISETPSSFNQEEFTELQNGLSNLYEKFGNVQSGEEIVISKDSVKVENGEEYVSSSLITSQNEVSAFSLYEEEENYVSLTSLEENYTVTEDEDSYTLTTADFTNRIIVSYDGELEAYNTEYYAEGLGYHIFQYETKEDTIDAYNYYSNLPYVDSVSYDYVIAADETTGEIAVEAFSTYHSWGADYTGIEDYMAYLNYLYTDDELETVYVAVLDSGVNTDHVLLKDKVDFTLSADCTSGSVVKGKSAVEDDNGHGSHTAGIIADQTKDNVKILSLKVLNSDGKGSSANILVAINYIFSLKTDNDLNIRVMNMSLGIEDENGNEIHNTSLENIVISAYNNYNIMSVVSAGNLHNDTISNCPANVDEAIVVSALARSMSIASYSNYGDTVDFCAPGSSIESAYINNRLLSDANYYKEESGTSMAAPHVTACIALLLSSPTYSQYTNAELIAELKSNAVDLGTSGWDRTYGYGCINISNFGMETRGEVEFSVTELNHTEAFEVTLSYDIDRDYTIYYTLDETTPGVNSSVYTEPITISSTTKINAVAYVNAEENDETVLKSEISTITYYFNNIDLDSNFVVEGNGLSGTLVSYTGELTTLNIQSVIDNVRITAIGENAFTNTNVQNVILPNTCTEIENHAFFNAVNLESITANAVQYIGNYSFAYCSNLTELFLPYARVIGQGAFDCLNLDKLTLGGIVSSFGEMQDFSVQTLECYTGTLLDSVYSQYAVNIVSINLDIYFPSGATRLISKVGQDIDFDVVVCGKFIYRNIYELTDSSGIEYSSYVIVPSETEIQDNYVTTVPFTISNLPVGTYTFSIYSIDYFNNITDEISITIVILESTATEYYLVTDSDNYTVYIDGQLAEDGFILYQGISDYEVTVESNLGYQIASIEVNGEVQEGTSFTLPTVNSNVNLSCTLSEIPNFSLHFVHSENVKVYIDDQLIENETTIDRNQDVMITVLPSEGYKIDQVLVNGQKFVLDANNSFTLTNVLQDFSIEITESIITYNIYLTYGYGGVSTSSVDQINYGESRSYEILVEEGYEIESVLVDGVQVEINENILSLENITADTYVVVSFTPIGAGLSEVQLTILILFLIILGIALIWATIEIVLKIRKNKKYNYKKNYSKHF